MNFELECDEQDGLVFIDEAYLKELNSDLLSEMDILLDVSGQTELINGVKFVLRCDVPTAPPINLVDMNQWQIQFFGQLEGKSGFSRAVAANN